LSYFEEITKAMTMLGFCGYTFLGQSVCYPGNAIYKTLKNVPSVQKIEMPVAEDMQMGISTGLSLSGYNIVSIFPRMDFLLLAMNQLVNHLDKIEELSHGIFRPKIIIRTMIGSKKPLDAGLQHTGDYTEMLKSGLKNVNVIRLDCAEMIDGCYRKAMQDNKSSIMIEMGELY